MWAPNRKTVDVVFQDPGRQTVSLKPDGTGYFAGLAEDADAGVQYKYRLDGAEEYPDPASRFQPDGPHAWSQVVDPHSFRWSDSRWPGLKIKGQIIYEMHIGTFTQGRDVGQRDRAVTATSGAGHYGSGSDAGS